MLRRLPSIHTIWKCQIMTIFTDFLGKHLIVILGTNSASHFLRFKFFVKSLKKLVHFSRKCEKYRFHQFVGNQKKPHLLKTLRIAVQFPFDIKYLIQIPIILLGNVNKSKSTLLHLENISWNQMVICVSVVEEVYFTDFFTFRVQCHFVKSFYPIRNCEKLNSRNFCTKIVKEQYFICENNDFTKFLHCASIFP